MRVALIACAAVALATGGATAAQACSQAETIEATYAGGDLASQIARKADTIQIVRASKRYLIRRDFTRTAWMLDAAPGEVVPPADAPEYIDTFVYEFEVVETLKGAAGVDPLPYFNPLRVDAYGATEHVKAFDLAQSPASLGPSLPSWLLDRPGEEGYLFSGGSVPAGAENSCRGAYFIDIGQTFVALRDSMGLLYFTGSPGRTQLTGLRIDMRYRSAGGRRERGHFNMQPLTLIDGPADPLIARLRLAIAASN